MYLNCCEILIVVQHLKTHRLDPIFKLLFLHCLRVWQMLLTKKEQRQVNAIQCSWPSIMYLGDSNKYYLMMTVMMKTLISWPPLLKLEEKRFYTFIKSNR